MERLVLLDNNFVFFFVAKFCGAFAAETDPGVQHEEEGALFYEELFGGERRGRDSFLYYDSRMWRSIGDGWATWRSGLEDFSQVILGIYSFWRFVVTGEHHER